MKTMIEIAIEHGAYFAYKDGISNIPKGAICFETEAQLKATIEDYNAQFSEPVAYMWEDDKSCYRIFGEVPKDEKVILLYTTTQSLPLEITPENGLENFALQMWWKEHNKPFGEQGVTMGVNLFVTSRGEVRNES